MKSLIAHFLNVFDYLFNAEWNPEYANAPHIKIVRDPDNRYPNNILIQALDCDSEIVAMCSYDGNIALEPMEVEYEPFDDEADCPNCADQESIAAPGQTVLCKTHDDEKHYADMKEFFIENLKDLHFKAMVPFCSACGKDAPDYAGVMMTSAHQPLTFAFCVDCRHELVMKQNALTCDV